MAKIVIAPGEPLELHIGGLEITITHTSGGASFAAKRGRKPGPQLAGAEAESATGGKRRKRRKMSAEARARIAEAQRKRWAKVKR